MKRLIALLLIVALATAGWYGYRQYAAQQAEEDAAAQADAEAVDDLENVIWASGNLEPVKWAALNPVGQGVVGQINVAEGDFVDAGTVLIELDNGVLRSQVESAHALLAEAAAAFEKLNAGATPADVAAAEAQLAAAEAGVSQAAGQMLEAQAAMDAAQAAVTMARRQYAEQASHPTAAERQVAQAQVAVSEAAVKQAQAAYNLVRGNPQIGALPESRMLYEATAALEAAQAQAALTEQGATPQQLAVAQSAIDMATAELNAAESRAPGVEAALHAAMANRDSAQAMLDKLNAGATTEEIAMAEARVQAAQAAVNSAEAQLRLNQIIAPFAGQVGAINVRVGELTQPDQEVVLLGDTREMFVKTTDLRETDVVLLSEGTAVEVTFDALPGKVFTGTVERIAPVSSSEQGSTNYTVDIAIPTLDETLRWGMTAFVNIQVR